ncbi:EVE domain-containing protein [Flavobacterium sp. HJSW_4]|uniref:EVE domain-containing protein n=1 Tax=Flavobacterium sp. HJSW_4 TaxID=3344660 RepID=UPI0035F2EA42
MKDRETKYWVLSASKDHVKNAVLEEIAQTCHGKASPLKRMKKGDYLIYYSGKQTLGKPEKCQQFTALGKVVDDDIFEFQVSEDFCPSRRKISFFPSNDISILPLIDSLDFIEDKKNWGSPFRFGILEINRQDFSKISAQMMN